METLTQKAVCAHGHLQLSCPAQFFNGSVKENKLFIAIMADAGDKKDQDKDKKGDKNKGSVST